MKSKKLIRELIRHARENSGFYRELYRELPEKIDELEALPVLPTAGFWEANSVRDSRVLTGPIRDGIILRSGGTTGKPKFSVFSRGEWEEFIRTFANHLAESGLEPGDRIANVFYSGELYGSFLFTHQVLENCPVPTVQVPVGGSTAPKDIYGYLCDFEATVLAGMPTTVLGIINAMEETSSPPPPKLRLILFAGEAMYPDQRERVLKAFPGITIRSIGYASTDAGLLGYTDPSCGANEFRCYDGEAIYEILDDETGAPIREPGHEGRAVMTSLKRKLMPVLRYPVGDRAMWVEPDGAKNRKFLLLGRADESARVGPITLHVEDIRAILKNFDSELGAVQFQLVTIHEDTLDGLILRIGTRASADLRSSLEPRIVAAFHQNRPLYLQFTNEKKVRPIRIEWVEPSGLEVNPRSGKLKRVVDKRMK